MNKFQTIHIGIIEPSHIIYEGISTLLLKRKQSYRLYRFDNTEEFYHSSAKVEIQVLMMNPSFVQHHPKVFLQNKYQYSHIFWVGIQYAYFEKEVLSLFDAILPITESEEHIYHIIDRHTEHSKETKPELTKGEKLSEREQDVLLLIVRGLSNKEISEKLFISIHTVISHRKNIVQKTGIKSQSGLTIYALSNKLIELDSF